MNVDLQSLKELRERLQMAVLSIDLIVAAYEPPEPEPPARINRGQIAAFHAMTAKIDELLGVPLWSTKARYKASYGKESTKDFTHADAHLVLNEIADELGSLTPA